MSDIRSNAQSKIASVSADDEDINDLEESYNYNIFNGTPDKDSPWAKFIDPDYDMEDNDDEEKRAPDEEKSTRI